MPPYESGPAQGFFLLKHLTQDNLNCNRRCVNEIEVNWKISFSDLSHPSSTILHQLLPRRYIGELIINPPFGSNFLLRVVAGKQTRERRSVLRGKVSSVTTCVNNSFTEACRGCFRLSLTSGGGSKSKQLNHQANKFLLMLDGCYLPFK